MKYELNVNGERVAVDVEPDTPLLWVVRDELGLTGSKYGCGIGFCGACTVYLDGEVARSCSLPISAVGNARVTTIEGLSDDCSHPVQQAWTELGVPQCGYCQSGQVLAAAAFLEKNPNPTEDDIRKGMTNLCRCGTYTRIVEGVLRAAKIRREKSA
jgi:aerobic-type carbon monoxide dehydrogenase small subunit (CoxS/CutS family)